MDSNYYKKYEPIFNSWHIKGLLGEGSFGKVYLIERQDFGVTYKAALKAITIPQSQSEVKSVMADGMDEESVTLYFRNIVEEVVGEFAIMSKLKGNSNVVSYEDHIVMKHESSIGWDILIRMELLTPLLDYIHKETLHRNNIIKLGIDICKALELCQKRNIIHRDIKPENIFISEDGEYKLGDFGIARTLEKTTGAFSKKGTYTYMAPEIYKGEPYGSNVDIYSLGIVMYRLLNENRTPFMPLYPTPITHNDRENALIKRLSGKEIPKPSCADGRLAEIVLKACEYNSKHRYSYPTQMKAELEAILYSKSEAKIFYPQGDTVKINPIAYAAQENDGTVYDKFDKTESILSKTPPTNAEDTLKTVSDFYDDKTESLFHKNEDRSISTNDGNFIFTEEELKAIANMPMIEFKDIIELGRYDNSPILWVVVDIQLGKIKLLSLSSLFEMRYEGTWELSDIRKYLNLSFIHSVFNKEQQACLGTVDNDILTLPTIEDYHEAQKIISQRLLLDKTVSWVRDDAEHYFCGFDGSIEESYQIEAASVRPICYLDTNVITISNGEGTIKSPYRLECTNKGGVVYEF